MQTSQLDQIMRQKDPELLKAVQHLANNETVKGIAMLAEQGRVTEIPNASAIASPPSPGTMPRSPRTPSSSPPTIGAVSRSMRPFAPSYGEAAHLPTTARCSAP